MQPPPVMHITGPPHQEFVACKHPNTMSGFVETMSWRWDHVKPGPGHHVSLSHRLGSKCRDAVFVVHPGCWRQKSFFWLPTIMVRFTQLGKLHILYVCIKCVHMYTHKLCCLSWILGFDDQSRFFCLRKLVDCVFLYSCYTGFGGRSFFDQFSW